MAIRTEDCLKAICDLVNGPDGGTILARAYNGTPDIPEFLKHCWMNDRNGNQIPANSIADVITQAGNLRNWRRELKKRVHAVGEFSPVRGRPTKPSINFRYFDCRPFDDQLRAYVWDDGVSILKVKITGE